MAIESGKVKKKSEKKRYFDHPVLDEAKPKEAVTGVKKPTKIVFTDNGEQRVVPVETGEGKSSEATEQDESEKGGKRKRTKGVHRGSSSLVTGDDGETTKRWYEHYDSFNTQGELVELKDAEILELRKLCRAAFDAECRARLKDNPPDGKWLQSAMEKGTTRDRASSGALLVQTNPFCNLQALETVIGMVKPSNKGHLDVVEVLTDLMLNSLMPSFRKLIPIQMRGADWRHLQKQDINKGLRDAVYAHWLFEEQLRELYFNFLTNLSVILHSGQDASKCKTIVHASKLFGKIPEKEAFMLTMLVNKLGDPSKLVAVKALYHLGKIVQQHSAMAFVVTSETEKLLFRNNVSNAAQHYALSFLSTISVYGDDATCKKMVNVCFAFFKILTDKGEINSRTMQAILTCLRKAIGSIKREVHLPDIVKPELMNVIFRMVHLADITVGCQGLSLLLEVTETRGPEQNRFYNTLYRKLLDPTLATVGSRISNILFYILHRAMQNDPLPERAQAFVKRLLQVSFYFSPSRVCAALIIINKVLRKRRYLLLDGVAPDEPEMPAKPTSKKGKKTNDDNGNDDDEGQPKPVRRPLRYDAFHRASEYAGANYTLKYELARYLSYFHPTVQKFAKHILSNTVITYYGDPLRDFSLAQFLERFSFKNPKKPPATTGDGSNKRVLGLVQRKKDYVPSGSRGLPVASLTKDQCTEDEHFIFQFLDQKRERMLHALEKKKARQKSKKGKDADDSEDDEEIDSDVDSLDDDEFDAYLDRLGVPGGQDGDANMDREELDFMQELGQDMSAGNKKGADKKSAGRKNAKASQEEDDEDGLDDWDEVPGDEEDDNDDDEDEFGPGGGDDDDEFSDGGSVSLEEGDDDEGEENDGPAVKKRKKSAVSVGGVSDRDFARKLKTTDMNSLFAAADDFSELLERNVDGPPTKKGGKQKRLKKSKIAGSHGTEGEVFNQDESSAKQMAWEQTRFSGKNHKMGGGGGGKKQFRPKKSAVQGKKNVHGRGGAGGGGGKMFGGKGKPKNRK
uniref:CCAAT-binding factor domain-containing protein n=1 Tax=Anopheles atroparvus TaxID=41427 RepID=A0AAG5DH49_ANOAO